MHLPLPPKNEMPDTSENYANAGSIYTSGGYIKNQKMSAGMSYRASKSNVSFIGFWIVVIFRKSCPSYTIGQEQLTLIKQSP